MWIPIRYAVENTVSYARALVARREWLVSVGIPIFDGSTESEELQDIVVLLVCPRYKLVCSASFALERLTRRLIHRQATEVCIYVTVLINFGPWSSCADRVQHDNEETAVRITSWHATKMQLLRLTRHRSRRNKLFRFEGKTFHR